MTKPLPKSLHTVTVIVNLARLLMRTRDFSTMRAVSEALTVLGYSTTNDPYGLSLAALKQLDKGHDL